MAGRVGVGATGAQPLPPPALHTHAGAMLLARQVNASSLVIPAVHRPPFDGIYGLAENICGAVRQAVCGQSCSSYAPAVTVRDRVRGDSESVDRYRLGRALHGGVERRVLVDAPFALVVVVVRGVPRRKICRLRQERAECTPALARNALSVLAVLARLAFRVGGAVARGRGT